MTETKITCDQCNILLDQNDYMYGGALSRNKRYYLQKFENPSIMYCSSVSMNYPSYSNNNKDFCSTKCLELWLSANSGKW